MGASSSELQMLARRRRDDRVGVGLTWLSGAALAFQMLLVVGLITLLGVHGAGYFWQRQVLEMRLEDGATVAGEVHAREPIIDHARGGAVLGARIKLKVGNQELTGQSFRWIDEAKILGRSAPSDLVLLERTEFGNFYGRLMELRSGTEVLAAGGEATWKALATVLPEAAALRARIRALERGEQAELNRELQRLRIAEKRVELDAPPAPERDRRLAAIAAERSAAEAAGQALSLRLRDLRAELDARQVSVVTADGKKKEIGVGNLLSALRPNEMSTGGRLALWGSRLWEFVSDEPRECNTEGGIFPAIFGTVLMVLIMTIVVVPLGVLAAMYLREYARQGWVVRLVRIAVNNLAGVPSIVFGVFGLGFFVYGIGGAIDRAWFPEAVAMHRPTFGTGGILWAALTLALLTVPVVIVATEEGLAAVPRILREGSLALGATKLETTARVVLPAAAPGILTGTILAIARAAGEVAPLMIVGMVKFAPLPLDGSFPFLHIEAKFMHLGFHVYDVGFQSPNVDAAQPLVFATAFLLVAIVTLMNLAAIALRNHLRSRYAASAV